MGISEKRADERVEGVRFTKYVLIVDLMDGRTISVPLVWYPRLLNATSKQRDHWELCGGGYGIHWPELDEDLSTEGILRGSPASSPSAYHQKLPEPTRKISSSQRHKRSRVKGSRLAIKK